MQLTLIKLNHTSYKYDAQYFYISILNQLVIKNLLS